MWTIVGGVTFVLLMLGLWWWVTRIPIDRRDSVSQAWRDQHKREGWH